MFKKLFAPEYADGRKKMGGILLTISVILHVVLLGLGGAMFILAIDSRETQETGKAMLLFDLYAVWPLTFAACWLKQVLKKALIILMIAALILASLFALAVIAGDRIVKSQKISETGTGS